MSLRQRIRHRFKQRGINRDVERGQKLYGQLISEGYTPEQIRQWWWENSGVKREDWPHDHDEGP